LIIMQASRFRKRQKSVEQLEDSPVIAPQDMI